MQRGLTLFGRDVSVCYDHWEWPTRQHINYIEINEVSYCLIDTEMQIMCCSVMCKEKVEEEKKCKYERKASHINANLVGVVRNIMNKIDLYQCPHTMDICALRARDGAWWWQSFWV